MNYRINIVGLLVLVQSIWTEELRGRRLLRHYVSISPASDNDNERKTLSVIIQA